MSDNGTPFTSIEFNSFFHYNGIKHITSPLYYPASNGAAENTVKTFKLRLKKILDNNKEISIQSVLCKYLFYYKNTVYTTTYKTPKKINVRKRCFN